MDIDNFRIINLLYGAEVCDNILIFVAKKLQECIETFDLGTYCRGFKDSFIACVEKDKDNISELIRFMLKSISKFNINFECSLTFGLYEINNLSVPIETMINRAEAAELQVSRIFISILFT